MNTSRDAVKSRVRREVDALFETFGHPDEACGSSQPEFQRQIWTTLAVLRVVQQQQGQLIGEVASRFAKRHMEANADEPLIAEPFDDYDALQQFDSTLVGTRKEVFVSDLFYEDFSLSLHNDLHFMACYQHRVGVFVL
ncbi:hypothetical protein MTO96_001176 [Rhipicephalus appendiculatus]